MKTNLNYDNLVARAYATVKTGDFLPVGIIALGGTGNRIGREIKARLQTSGAQSVPLLAIDSDSAENQKYPELPPLDVPGELVLLNPDVALRALAKAQERHPSQAHILDYLPDEIDGETAIHSTIKVKIATGSGAGQFRRAGKLLLNTNVGSSGVGLKSRFEQFRAELIGVRSKQEKLHTGVRFKDRTKLFVLASLMGGFGAGTLIDILALIRLIFPEPSHEVTVIAVLPGEALDRELKNKQETAVTRANAIATLMELQAIRTGKVLPLTFRFDNENEVVIRDGASFANAVYLVDNALITGNPVGSYMALCRAVANFIYAFIGTGVGAAEASSAVNVLDAKNVDGQPHIFSALGVSYLEFPAQPLRRYSVLTAASKWTERWMTPTADGAGAKAADALLIELSFTDADQWRETLHRSLAVESYAIVGERREKLLKYTLSDDRFFSEIQKLRRRIHDDVRDYIDRLPALEKEAARTRLDSLNQRFTSLYAANLGDTFETFGNLVRRLRALKSLLAGESDKNSRLRKSVEAELGELEKAIRRKNLPPPFSDKPERSRYLNVLKQLAELDVSDATLPARLAIVQAIEQRAGELQSQLQALHADLLREREKIASECQRLENTAGPDEFGSWVISAHDFPAWAATLSDKLEVPVSLDAETTSAASVLAKLVTAFDAPIWDAITRVNIAEIAGRDDAVRHRMQALAEMARPLMQFVPTAPLESELLPMTFVAGNLPDQAAGKKFVESMITAVRGTNWEPVHTGNPHLWLCCTVRRGFAVTHWQGFDGANRHYLRQRGKHHTLANWQSVPLLHQTSREEAEAQVTIGLGMLSELIIRRGNNYYVNFERTRNSGTKDRIKFATFTKERGPMGRALLEHGLIDEAMASERLPGESLLGNSLDAAINALRQPVFGEVGTVIRTTLDELGRTKIGFVEMKRQIVGWIETQLVPEIGKATTRRDLLQTVAERLKAYAETLGRQV